MNVDRLLGGAVVALALTLAVDAAAAPQSEASAESLFKDAKKLAADGKFAEACPKYEESQRLAPAAGTLVNLADCYEKVGKTASAWATFKEASRAAAVRKRQDWVKLSTERAAALEPKLPKLTIVVAPDAKATSGLEVKRDGATVGSGEWGVAVPVDPGDHTVEASAPGKKTFTTKIATPPEKTATVTVASLAAQDGPSAAASTTPAPKDDKQSEPARAVEVSPASSSGKTIGYVLGGVGIVALGVGGVTGVMALGKKSDAKDLCPSYPDCTNRGASDPNDSAKSLATVSTIGFIAGGVLVAAGAYFVLTSKTSTTAVRVQPAVGTREAGVQVGATF